MLDVAARKGAPFEVEVQVITLGQQLALVSLPGEVFVELGLSIKQASPFAYTMIAELANGSIGYIPNKPAYAEGNYEVVSARCAEGAGELLVTAAVLPARWLLLPVRALRRQRRVERGLCPGCGYDLRATPGRCQECGASPDAEGRSIRAVH